MKTLILFRGLPGAGKTDLANKLCDIVYAADDYFTVDGEYKFNLNLLTEAHEACQNNVADAMNNSINIVGVANTFTTEKEMKPYEDLASFYNYRIYHIIVENRRGTSEECNIHSVPVETIQRMRNRFSVKLG